MPSPSQRTPPPQSRQIILQVGERRFVTTRDTLVAESDFFECLLSGQWDNKLPDGSYFLDADPALFEHILRYLRRGVFPIFYDLDKGHDYALYAALLGEARYFQIKRLQDWLEKQRYLHALRVECSAEKVRRTGSLSTTLSTDVKVEYVPGWGTQQVFHVCPNWITRHTREPDACLRSCINAHRDSDALRFLVVKKRMVFDMQACVAGR